MCIEQKLKELAEKLASLPPEEQEKLGNALASQLPDVKNIAKAISESEVRS
ncbi:MAG: hypothetical protein Q4E13_08540 [Clostridia bacterium]|nr:hypothetical protein [Clostridia bacterium]